MLFVRGRQAFPTAAAAAALFPPAMGFAPSSLRLRHPSPGHQSGHCPGSLVRAPAVPQSAFPSGQFQQGLTREDTCRTHSRILLRYLLPPNHTPEAVSLQDSARSPVVTSCQLRRYISQAGHLEPSFLFSTHLAASDSYSHS